MPYYTFSHSCMYECMYCQTLIRKVIFELHHQIILYYIMWQPCTGTFIFNYLLHSNYLQWQCTSYKEIKICTPYFLWPYFLIMVATIPLHIFIYFKDTFLYTHKVTHLLHYDNSSCHLRYFTSRYCFDFLRAWRNGPRGELTNRLSRSCWASCSANVVSLPSSVSSLNVSNISSHAK
mgnify:CR=1 FL=1